MMNDFDISDVENWAVEYVRSLGVSKNIYTDRPKSIEEGKDEFAIVGVSGDVADQGAYGVCELGVDLYARDIQHRKNGKKLSVMFKKLIEGFPCEEGRYIANGIPVVIGDVGDDFNYHARMLQIKIIIKNQ